MSELATQTTNTKLCPKTRPSKHVVNQATMIDRVMQSTAILARDLNTNCRDTQNPSHSIYFLIHLLVDRSPIPLRELRLIMKMLGHLQSRDDMVMAQLRLLARGKQSSDLQDVLNLATIHIHLRKLVELILRDGMLLCRGVEEI